MTELLGSVKLFLYKFLELKKDIHNFISSMPPAPLFRSVIREVFFAPSITPRSKSILMEFTKKALSFEAQADRFD